MVFSSKIAQVGILFSLCLIIGCSTNNPKIVTYIDPLGAGMALSDSELSRQKAKAKRGNLIAIRSVYEHYEFGKYDEMESTYWLQKLAESGDDVSQYNFGQQLIEQGKTESGAKWVQKALAQGFRP